jgi:hypothetical protein
MNANPLLDFYRRVEVGEVELPMIQGGPGSGNFGHAGRPGKIGGSSTGKIGGSSTGKGGGKDKGFPSFNSLSPAAQKEIDSLEFDTTNDVLRNGANRTDHSSKIDEAFEKYGIPLKSDQVGFRGSKGLVYPTEVGKKFVDKGYLRFSADENIGSIFTHKGMDVQVVRVHVPSGTKVLPAPHTFEKEMLLPRNSTFQVTKVKKSPNGGYYDANGNPVRAYRYDIEMKVVKD